MESEIFSSAPMNADQESEWIAVSIDKYGKNYRQSMANSLQIVWQDVTGGMDGTIQLLVTNNPDHQTKGKFYNIGGSLTAMLTYS